MSETAIRAEAQAFIEKNRQNIISDIAALVAVNSVEGPPEDGAPFGPGPRDALALCLNIARRHGLSTVNEAERVGWADTDGGDGVLAMVTHVDVVAPGDGWDADPFTLRERDGWLLGRGVLDDKGPAVLTIYAAEFLNTYCKQNGIAPKYTVRTIFGTNEESGMDDIPHYLAACGQPVFCFSPDADFPVCVGEKGLLTGDFISAPLTGPDARIVGFSGGVASNVVPDSAVCTVRAAAGSLPDAPDISVTYEDGLATIAACGICGHAAKPEHTKNAIGVLVAYLLKNQIHGEKEFEFLNLLQKLFTSTDGAGLGIACRDGLFGALTCVGGTIRLQDGRLVQNINIRFPQATSGEALDEALKTAAAAHGAAFARTACIPLFYQAPASPPIQALLRAYEAVTGEKGEPFTIGGGTYARKFRSAASFGPHFPGEARPAFANGEHMANEGASVASLLQALEIYILALWNLLQ